MFSVANKIQIMLVKNLVYMKYQKKKKKILMTSKKHEENQKMKFIIFLYQN